MQYISQDMIKFDVFPKDNFRFLTGYRGTVQCTHEHHFCVRRDDGVLGGGCGGLWLVRPENWLRTTIEITRSTFQPCTPKNGPMSYNQDCCNDYEKLAERLYDARHGNPSLPLRELQELERKVISLRKKRTGGI